MSAAENPPAFPSMKPLDHWGDPHRGMDLRDWFAGQALVGLTRADPWVGDRSKAEMAYDIADAMMFQRGQAK